MSTELLKKLKAAKAQEHENSKESWFAKWISETSQTRYPVSMKRGSLSLFSATQAKLDFVDKPDESAIMT